MAYFSMWQPHGNRVSKTRFITLINIEKNPEHIREEPRGGGGGGGGEKPRLRATRQRAAQVPRGPGSAPPRQCAT